MKIFKKTLLFLFFFAFGISAAGASTYAKEEDSTPDYIYGRPMTEEEIARQKSYEPDTLVPMVPFIPSESDGSSLFTAPVGASYSASYDARDSHLVTPVKDQGDTNWCWAYSTVSAMETSMIKKKLTINGNLAADDNTDLSEASLVYCMYNRTVVADPFRNTLRDINQMKRYDTTNYDEDFLEFSGNSTLLSQFLSTSMGIWEEASFSIEDFLWTGDPSTIIIPSFSTAYTDNVAYLKNTRYIANDTNSIKAAILTYGSVVVSYDYEDDYYNYHTAAYSHPSSDSTNHAVVIVGWDDSYSSDNFFPASNVTRNGAWIVKNSWSEGWGDDGYFYLSYYDGSLYPQLALEMQSTDAYDHNYFFDGSSGTAFQSGSSGTKFANVFTSSGRQQLKQVSFEARNPHMSYSIQVYKNVSGTYNPESGTPALSKPITGTADGEGIYTIDLPSKVFLDSGERFSVVITATTSDQSTVRVACEYTTDYDWYSCSAGTARYQSYIKHTNDTWADLSYYDNCLRIKAYTDDSDVKKVTFKDSKGVVTAQYVAPGASASLASVKKAGYSIASTTGTYQNVTKDSTVTVAWTPNKYTVTFNGNGGKVSKSKKSVTYATKYQSLPTPKRKGYDFMGWYTSKSYKTKVTASTTYKTAQNQTLYAKWKKVSVAKSSIKKLTSPKAKRIKVTFKKISGATGYEVCYSTKRNMSGSKKILTTKTSRTIGNLRSGKTYYVRVRAYHKDSAGNKVWGKYSATKKITVK